MKKITCGICMDLIPLVRDGVASTDSKNAVLEHIRSCNECNAYFNDFGQEVVINDKKVFNKIRRQVNMTILMVIGLSILFGVSLTMSENMFYNVIIMPVIGGGSYIILKNKVYIMPLFVFSVSFIWHFIMYYGEVGFEGFFRNLITPLYWALIYSGLCTLGVIVAFLLYFAFRKENK